MQFLNNHKHPLGNPQKCISYSLRSFSDGTIAPILRIYHIRPDHYSTRYLAPSLLSAISLDSHIPYESYLAMLHLYLPILQPPLTILLLLTAASFLLHLLVLLGSTSNTSFLRSLYFRRFYDVSRHKGVAGTPGRSSFFQVGLWNYCEGFGDRALVCEVPQEFWWFNPMEEVVEKLFSGAGS